MQLFSCVTVALILCVGISVGFANDIDRRLWRYFDSECEASLHENDVISNILSSFSRTKRQLSASQRGIPPAYPTQLVSRYGVLNPTFAHPIDDPNPYLSSILNDRRYNQVLDNGFGSKKQENSRLQMQKAPTQIMPYFRQDDIQPVRPALKGQEFRPDKRILQSQAVPGIALIEQLQSSNPRPGPVSFPSSKPAPTMAPSALATPPIDGIQILNPATILQNELLEINFVPSAENALTPSKPVSVGQSNFQQASSASAIQGGPYLVKPVSQGTSGFQLIPAAQYGPQISSPSVQWLGEFLPTVYGPGVPSGLLKPGPHWQNDFQEWSGHNGGKPSKPVPQGQSEFQAVGFIPASQSGYPANQGSTAVPHPIIVPLKPVPQQNQIPSTIQIEHQLSRPTSPPHCECLQITVCPESVSRPSKPIPQPNCGLCQFSYSQNAQGENQPLKLYSQGQGGFQQSGTSSAMQSESPPLKPVFQGQGELATYCFSQTESGLTPLKPAPVGELIPAQMAQGGSFLAKPAAQGEYQLYSVKPVNCEYKPVRPTPVGQGGFQHFLSYQAHESRPLSWKPVCQGSQVFLVSSDPTTQTEGQLKPFSQGSGGLFQPGSGPTPQGESLPVKPVFQGQGGGEQISYRPPINTDSKPMIPVTQVFGSAQQISSALTNENGVPLKPPQQQQQEDQPHTALQSIKPIFEQQDRLLQKIIPISLPVNNLQQSAPINGIQSPPASPPSQLKDDVFAVHGFKRGPVIKGDMFLVPPVNERRLWF